MPANRGLSNHCLAAASCWSYWVIPFPDSERDELEISFLSSKTTRSYTKSPCIGKVAFDSVPRRPRSGLRHRSLHLCECSPALPGIPAPIMPDQRLNFGCAPRELKHVTHHRSTNS